MGLKLTTDEEHILIHEANKLFFVSVSNKWSHKAVLNEKNIQWVWKFLQKCDQ